MDCSSVIVELSVFTIASPSVSPNGIGNAFFQNMSKFSSPSDDLIVMLLVMCVYDAAESRVS